MHQEFKRIMDFFKMSAEERGEKLESVFEDSLDFFERFRYILENGSFEEKKEVMEEFAQMQDKLREEMQKLQDTTGMSPDELEKIANDPENFSDEQWEVISKARGKIEKEAQEISGLVDIKEQKGPSRSAPNSAASKKKKKKKWLKS